jgi:hypothetical protein
VVAGTLDEAVVQTLEFVKGRGVRRLNVAGPRASGESRAYYYAFELVRRLLNQRG